MNTNEKAIIKIIKENPYITQKELGDRLNLTRSTIATLVSNLMQKNIIKGRGYILNNIASGIYCIGGMNVDRKFNLLGDFIPKTSNPASSQIFVGGVGRNVCENLGRLGHRPYLISVAGFDQDFEFIKSQSTNFVNFDYVKQFKDATTGSYSAVLNSSGDMVFAIADMSIYEKMNLEWIKNYSEVLKTARLIIVDLNTPRDVVEFIINFCNENSIELIIVAVSSPKMNRLPKKLAGVTWLIVNQDESEAYFDLKINNENDLSLCGEKWLDTGLENIIVTRGTKSSIYGNKYSGLEFFYPLKAEKPIDVTGAGDSFTAGIIYGHLMDYKKNKTIELAIANAYYTVQRKETVRLDLTRENLELERLNLKKEGKLK